MSPPAIGFIGFGEAGSHIAKGLRSAGANRLFAYDIHTDTPLLGDRIQTRAGDTGTTLVRSSQELVQASEILLSVVTAHSALDAAAAARPFLAAGHIYTDLNSVSPGLKRRIADEAGANGARFVEGSIMAPVPPYGHRVPILVNGPAAGALVKQLEPLGMRLETLDAEIGAAAAVKMCRSIIVKGLEALIFECVMAAGRYGADERVFASLDETFPGMNWRQLADYMVGRVVVHGERRAREMEEVAQMLRDAGVDPIMAEATARRQDWCARMDLRAAFASEGPQSYREVLEHLSIQKEG